MLSHLKMLKYIWAIVKSHITPMLLAQEYEDNKTSRITKIHFYRNRNDVLKLFTEGASRKSYAKFIRVDLGLGKTSIKNFFIYFMTLS